MESPQQIVEAFDECLIYVYGSGFARDNPHKSDIQTASKWCVAGLTVVLATIVFYDRMSYMQERFLRIADKNDRSLIPHSLKLFDENIEAALRRQRGDGAVDTWEKEISKWRARCQAWSRKPSLWRVEMWGPEPFSDGCRAPHTILKEIKKDVVPNDYEKLREGALDKRFEYIMDRVN